MKKILAISTSLHVKSNSEILLDAFVKGAKESGNDVEKISLKGKNISFCKGCCVCQKTLKCVIKDDAVDIVEKMKNADVILWASPLYYYDVSGQMKTLIDRANCLYISDYKFREVYLIMSAAENEKNTFDRALSSVKGWLECLNKAKLVNTLLAGGLENPNQAKDSEYEKLAYEMGKNV